jgi:DNA-binding SARP family transcriptional activator
MERKPVAEATEAVEVEGGPPGSPNAGLADAVFQGHPYGIAVVDGQKRVVAHNAAARRMLGPHAALLWDTGPGAACRLGGCPATSACHGGACLFERALAAAGPLPEVRVDLPRGAMVSAAWLTAAALAGVRSHVIVELRPGQAGDRRRHTDLSWARQPQLRIVSLGRTRVETAEGPLGGPWLRQRPGQLLKYLVSQRRHPVPAEMIAERLWPDAGPRALRGLRYYVHALRERLEPFDRPRAGSSYVLYEDGGYRLSPVRVTIDADEFEREVTAGLQMLRDGDHDAFERLTRALSLYEGDFLADEPYAEWAIAERDRLASIAADGLRALADLRIRRGDTAGAARDLDRLAVLEPFDVGVHRQLISLALRRGRRSDAVRRHEAFRRRLLTTFGQDVDFSLTDLIAGDP